MEKLLHIHILKQYPVIKEKTYIYKNENHHYIKGIAMKEKRIKTKKKTIPSKMHEQRHDISPMLVADSKLNKPMPTSC